MENRRRFLSRIGQGAVAAAVGFRAADAMGFAPPAPDDEDRLHFGPLEPLVGLLLETPIDRLLPVLVEQLKAGVELRRLVAAAALANARTFGGEDYVGFHTMMALSPAFRMSGELSGPQQALPVFKVLYRNGARLQEFGGRAREVLKPVRPAPLAGGGPALREAVRRKDAAGAEAMFASLTKPADALNALLHEVQDNTEVHRVALPYRAWDLLDVVGPEHANTLLRQSLRYCLKSEGYPRHARTDEPRTLLPKLFDEHKLEGRALGARTLDDAGVEALSRTIFESAPAAAAGAVAAALAEGVAPDAVGEAISLAANQLVLRDPGRAPSAESPGKPVGSVHGDSMGVHACDSANAWRHLARASDARNTFACLVLGAYQAALDRRGDVQKLPPLPLDYHVTRSTAAAPEELLRQAEAAIRDNLQAHACAAVARYGALGLPERPVFDLLLRYAVSEDGALHAEKYYRTVSEEFAATRPAFRWRQLVALARVTASEHGRPAPGVAESRRLLGV